MPEPLFPESVRKGMLLGTSSRWAADLNREDLDAIIWMIGELGRRASHVLAAVEEQWAVNPPKDVVAATRAKLAIEGLFRVFSGERPSEAEYIARWPRVSEQAWAKAEKREPELNPEEMGDRWPIVWNGHLVGSLKNPRHQLYGCVGQWVPTVPVSEPFAVAIKNLPEKVILAVVGGVPALIEQPLSESGEFTLFWVGSGT